MTDSAPHLRSLPAVGALVGHPLLREAAAHAAPAALTAAAREAIAEERARRQAGQAPVDAAALARQALERLRRRQTPRLRRVVNATGVVLHTNLGRAPLAPAALEGLMAVAGGYSNLELDLDSGARGSRHDHVEALLRHLTGAEAALVVNNCAAAVLLVVDALARGREVVVSRGQLVEIGGSFRLPEVITGSGARLVEVGTTNKTYMRDYERAIGPDTGLLMLSHPSNFRVVGFTAEVDRRELAALGHSRGIVTVEDLGHGLLVDLARFGLPPEPTVAESLESGLDLVTVSGDKLLGGPQAGLVLGRRDLIEALRRHPLMRALRPDKLALAALEGTLRLYLDPERVEAEVPIFRAMARSPEALQADATRLAGALAPLEGLAVEVVAGTSAVGGGTLPGVELPTWLVALRPAALSVDALAERLRTGDPPVVGRIAEGRLLLDPRTLLDGDEARIHAALAGALAR